MTSQFKKVFSIENQQLSNQKNASLKANGKSYVFAQELLKDFEKHLEEGEHILGLIPLTNQTNSSVMNTGVMGMAYARNPKARQYVETFNSVRGNRLLFFTEERIIFMTVVDYLEEDLYYSYPYQSIERIKIKKRRLGYFDWSQHYKPRRNYQETYTLDFQSNNHVFTELMTQKDIDTFLQKKRLIPKMRNIPITDKTHRNNLFDLLFSNVSLQVKLFSFLITFFGLIFLVIFLITYFKNR